MGSRAGIVIQIPVLLLICGAFFDRCVHKSRWSADANLRDVNISAILESLQHGYDKRVRPNYGGIPVEVGVTMFVLSISSLSEVNMDFTLDFYFRQFWRDPRLEFTSAAGIDMLSVGTEFIQKIWVPDTFFVNEKSSYFHKATTSNEFLRIKSDGNVVRSIRLTITAACAMDLQYFPMDSQLCKIEIESFGYTMRDIRYKWNEGSNSVGVSGDVSLPQFKVLGHRQQLMEISLTTGNYSRLACEIQFVRSMGYYLIQIYIPSGLIVVISWVSFWINRNATVARVALGVMTVLTMTTLMSSTNAALPKISYVKSIDIYLGTCFVMVFASLLEYAALGYMAKRIQLRKNRYNARQKLADKETGEIVQQPNPRPSTHHGHFEPEHQMVPKPVRHWMGMAVERGQSEHIHQVVTSDPYSPPSHHGEQSQNIRYKIHDPNRQRHSQGVLEMNVEEITSDDEAGTPVKKAKDEPGNTICGMTPSDIDKYSRIVFPVCFFCFNMMYWIIYLHISDIIADDLVLLEATT